MIMEEIFGIYPYSFEYAVSSNQFVSPISNKIILIKKLMSLSIRYKVAFPMCAWHTPGACVLKCCHYCTSFSNNYIRLVVRAEDFVLL
jgi:predicted benzoate:H+ symporter BenE